MQMRATLLMALLLPLAFAAAASDVGDASILSKSMASAAANAASPRQADAPFRRGHDPMPELILREEIERRGPRGACESSATDLCYDMHDARMVYRPARRYMPTVDGLRAESVSLRRDRIVFKYSFR
jgi:hypothetical protein